MVNRSFLYIAAALVLLVSCGQKQEAGEPQVIPQPTFLQRTEGSFCIDRSLNVKN